jgi:ADP-ribose pyrophosphatase YjhB (NUDIX family)
VKLICIANNKILLIRPKSKGVFNLVGGWVDYWETIPQTIEREFLEETGHILWKKTPKLLHVEIKHFPKWWQFDGVVNIFYLLSFDTPFDIILEEWVYEEYKWCSKEELQNLPVSDHTNKELLLSLL